MTLQDWERGREGKKMRKRPREGQRGAPQDGFGKGRHLPSCRGQDEQSIHWNAAQQSEEI
eukprot:scaffold405_cov243-Pinguiococcus_pyrenoidosus.AAC.10